MAERVFQVVGKKKPVEAEKHFLVFAKHKLKDHLARAEVRTRDVGGGTGRGRISSKDLLNEAERILIRTGSGMNLLERL